MSLNTSIPACILRNNTNAKDNTADSTSKSNMLILYVLAVITSPPVAGGYNTDKQWRPEGRRCECCIGYLNAGKPAL
jgi:hypothetical protein